MTVTSVTYTRTLALFAKHERSTRVCCSIETVVKGLPQGRQVSTADEYADDAALLAAAQAAGRATWDEDDICTVLDCARAVTGQEPT